MARVVDILILGAGWTSDFLIPLLTQSKVSFAATTRNGGKNQAGHDTIKFLFDPESEDPAPFEALPDAETVLITFPIYKSGGSATLVRHWKMTHSGSEATAFIQLGSTGIWSGGPTVKDDGDWADRHSKFDANNDRANAESELLALSPHIRTTVLNLCGLWGGKRHVRNWVPRVAPTKEALKNKGSIHMIHGVDVSRAILVVHKQIDKAVGQRWMLTDGRVYDWWDLASAWGQEPNDDQAPEHVAPQLQWVRELMNEADVRALPRPPKLLGRVLDSRDFWTTFGTSPIKPRLDASS